MSRIEKNYLLSTQNKDEKDKFKEHLIKLERTLISIFDYLNENEIIIQTSGKLWNNLFSLFNFLNQLKTSALENLGIPKSEDIWKTTYVAEKINQHLYLIKLQNENKKLKKNNIES